MERAGGTALCTLRNPFCVFSQCKTEQHSWRETGRECILFWRYSWEMKANSNRWIFNAQFMRKIYGQQHMGGSARDNTRHALCMSDGSFVMKQESIKFTLEKAKKPESRREFYVFQLNINGWKLFIYICSQADCSPCLPHAARSMSLNTYFTFTARLNESFCFKVFLVWRY